MWGPLMQLLLMQLAVLTILWMAWKVSSKRVRCFIARNWDKVAGPLWAILFIIISMVAGILDAIVVATTTCLLGKLMAKFTLWLYQRPEEKRTTTDTDGKRFSVSYFQRRRGSAF